jgi:hypothetical protein
MYGNAPIALEDLSSVVIIDHVAGVAVFWGREIYDHGMSKAV